MNSKLQQLKERLLEVDDLNNAVALMSWDQATYMPTGGGPARGRQRATLARLAHEKFADPAIGKLLDALGPYAEGLPYESDEASLLRVTRRMYEKEIKVPGEFIARSGEHAAASYDAWVKARPANDFSLVQPLLEKTLDYSRQYAGFFPGYEHIADPIVDNSQDGMTSATIRQLFTELRTGLVPLVKTIAGRPPLDDSPLRRHFPEAQQLAFCHDVVQRLGYDLTRGRIDRTRHPFMTKFSLGDVRITTRFSEDHLGAALFSSMHEAGHAMYEQGINPAYEGTPLARGASSGAHESQSRLWENLVGRSRGFWQHMFPVLQSAFPAALRDVSAETFYRASNRVEPGLIRTAADEVTYNLHIMIRFELEQDLLEGRVSVRDLPRVWRERYHADLGVTAPDDRDGVLQDVHWYKYLIGGSFHAYTLGNIMAAQFYEAALQAHPEIPAQVARGDLTSLRAWLTENIYRHGRKFTPPELMQRATGRPLTIEPYLRYLREKYTELYA